MARNVGAIKVDVQVRQAWWWKPALKVVYFAACYRLISIDTAQKLANVIANNSFKYRIGEKWRKINGMQVTVERQ